MKQLIRRRTNRNDPTHGRIDPDIQRHVGSLHPDSLGQRVAMENTLQERRGLRGEVNESHKCGRRWAHRWRWMRWLCNACKGDAVTYADHMDYGWHSMPGTACRICWGPS